MLVPDKHLEHLSILAKEMGVTESYIVDLALVDFFEENTIASVMDRNAYMAHIKGDIVLESLEFRALIDRIKAHRSYWRRMYPLDN